MAVDVTIKSKGLFKKTLSIQDILLDGMKYGITDEAFRLEEGKIGKYTVIYDSSCINRGYEISFKRGITELRMPLPTSEQDIKKFYELIEKICKLMNTNVFIHDDEKVSINEIDSLMDGCMRTSEAVLKSMREETTAEKEGTYLFGAMNPICFGKRELDFIQDDPKKLGEFMHELQSKDVYYAKCNAYKRVDGSIFGVYILTEDVVTVLPCKASLFMNNNIEVNDYNISFVIDGNLSGSIPYDVFLKNVDQSNIYDSEHFIISLSRDKMIELLKQYKIDL